MSSTTWYHIPHLEPPFPSYIPSLVTSYVLIFFTNVVFQDNQQISLAPAKFNETTSNILSIPSGKSQVPSATAVSNPTTLTLGSNLSPSNLPNGQTPTGTGGAIGTGTSGGSGSSSAASGLGLYGSGTGVVFGFTTCICVLLGSWLAL